MTRSLLLGFALVAGAAGLSGCPQVTYENPGSVQASADWSDTDIREAADKLGASLAEYVEKDNEIAGAASKPAILALSIKRKTDRHINTDIIIERIQTAVLKSGKVKFIDGNTRPDLDAEYAYMASGRVDPKTQKAPGKQTGAEYVLVGEIRNVRARLNDKSTVNYYYIALKMVNVTSSEICWKGETETKKRTTK